MPIMLFEHNETAYKKAISMLETTRKAAVIHPTGTGKSFIGFKLCEDNPAARVCWLSPSEYIFNTQIENLKKTGASVPNNIFFYTYSKLTFMTDDDLADIAPDFIILDEFHRCGAEVWGESVGKLLKKNKCTPVLGLSATSIRYLDNQRDMADELFDGNVASEITLGEAIVKGILPSPKYVTALYSYSKDLKNYEKRIANYKNSKMKENAEMYLEALKRAIQNSEGLDEIFSKHITEKSSKYIVFCANKEHMDEMVARVHEWFGKIDDSPNVYSVYANDPEANSDFANFKADKSEHLKLLFCIDMLNEGVHVDDIDGVILFRPTVSPIVFKQQIGRALSTGCKKNPIIFDIVDNIGNLYSVNSIEKEMQEAIRFMVDRGDNKYIVNDKFYIFDEVRSCREIFAELEGSLVSSWDFMFEKASEYYQVHGNLIPPSDYKTEEGLSLGLWVNTQRSIFRGKTNGTLTEERISRLESIGMQWQTLRERQWNEGFELAKAFYDKNGHLDVSKKQKKLSQWIVHQRQKYKNGDLSGEEISMLNSIGMKWNPIDELWEVCFEAAKRYFEEHETLDIPVSYVDENGLKLGKWYHIQRKNYKKGLLSDERKQRLETIGINWTSVKIRNWMNYYTLVKDYFVKYGNIDIKSDYVTPNGEKLGAWIQIQRERYARGHISEDQIRMLNKLNMSWNRYESSWNKGYDHALAYHNKYGNINCLKSYIDDDGFELGSWIVAQRHRYKSGKLPDNRVKLLEELNIAWDVNNSKWDENFKEAKQYYECHGDLLPSNCYQCDNGLNLKSWLSNLRTRYKNGKLSQEQILSMESIGMIWDLNEFNWNRNFECVKKHLDEIGDLSIPINYVTEEGFKLGNWIYENKDAYKKGKLSENRIKKLESIGIMLNESDVK